DSAATRTTSSASISAALALDRPSWSSKYLGAIPSQTPELTHASRSTVTRHCVSSICPHYQPTGIADGTWSPNMLTVIGSSSAGTARWSRGTRRASASNATCSSTRASAAPGRSTRAGGAAREGVTDGAKGEEEFPRRAVAPPPGLPPPPSSVFGPPQGRDPPPPPLNKHPADTHILNRDPRHRLAVPPRLV